MQRVGRFSDADACGWAAAGMHHGGLLQGHPRMRLLAVSRPCNTLLLKPGREPALTLCRMKPPTCAAAQMSAMLQHAPDGGRNVSPMARYRAAEEAACDATAIMHVMHARRESPCARGRLAYLHTKQRTAGPGPQPSSPLRCSIALGVYDTSPEQAAGRD